MIVMSPARATHILGGEITYKCNDQNGLYEFTVVVIRDCGGSTSGFSSSTINLQGPHGTTLLPLVAAVDMSPKCGNSSFLQCNPPATGQGNIGSMAKFIFKGEVNLSNLSAPPVGTGYTFWVTVPCCRPPGIINSMATSGSYSFTAKMFRFVDPGSGNPLTPTQLCDNSPAFNHEPAQLYVLNPADTIYHQQGGFEPDFKDSMVYNVGFSLSEQRVPFSYIFPYSIVNPIPGLLGTPTVPAANSPIHPGSGEIVFRPVLQGLFVLPVEVKSYRGGQLISEVRRDYALRIIPNPPAFPPLNAPTAFQQRPPLFSIPTTSTSIQSGFDWEFYAGDSIAMNLGAQDYFPTLTGDPNVPSTWVAAVNPLRVAVSGGVVASNQIAGTGCSLPPCAVIRAFTDSAPPTPALNPPVLVSFGNANPVAFGFTGLSESWFRLFWNTSCIQTPSAHLSQGAHDGNVYKILLTALDSSCPFEYRVEREVKIKLRNLPLTPAPVLRELRFDTTAFRYTLHFEPRIDTSTIDPLDANNFGRQSAAAQKARSVNRRLASFQSYRIYRADGMQTPWILVGTTTNPFDSLFIDTSLFSTNHQVFYQVVAVSGCGSSELGSNILQASFSSTSVQDLAKRLNHVRLMPNPGRDVYRLQADEGHFLPQRWDLRDIQGRLLQAYVLPEGTTSHELDLSNRPSGIYLLQAAESGKAIRLVHQP
jgi:hypothetical protein